MKRVFVTESLLVYLCTLILALVLTILVVHNGVLGLLLYLSLSILLSHAFKQLFIMYQSIEEKANSDQRTGLFNHSYFENMLEIELNTARTQGTPLCLGLLDIDDFKNTTISLVTFRVTACWPCSEISCFAKLRVLP